MSKNAKLDYQLGYLVIRMDTTIKIHLSELSILILESTAISLTAYLLSELNKKKVKVIFCDEKRNPTSELIPYHGSHDTSAKIRNQIGWSKLIKDEVWTEIVTEKIRKQRSLLAKLKKHEYNILDQYVAEIEYRDKSNREGHAAKVYFNALFGIDFTRTADNSINAGLNYGYGILLSIFNREVAANGYITQLGLFHDNIFNPFNLASDLMEPFRIIVDDWIYNLNLKEFEHDEKMAVLKILEREVGIEGRREYLPNAIRIYCKSVFDALNEKNPSMIRFYRNEL
ncbi:CRISPR-associated protein, Cas1 family [Alkalibacter saccharofermentans DSM 14828]|uniref:CRISPR-associated protein, Cas1 family n=1 Tax=Alkalibacter saccharofermentans DSM 14828 TaxID=1120975 RepID=A0A1M4Z1T1_9FIRM|nr:CRISPR-associated protein, Cas1 family [Alkalibacter saccharofermentans DSM 14828]